MTWQHIALFVALWLWKLMNPELPRIVPVEMIDAAKAVTATAQKWGTVADGINSWGFIAVLIVGVAIGIILMAPWNRK